MSFAKHQFYAVRSYKPSPLFFPFLSYFVVVVVVVGCVTSSTYTKPAFGEDLICSIWLNNTKERKDNWRDHFQSCAVGGKISVSQSEGAGKEGGEKEEEEEKWEISATPGVSFSTTLFWTASEQRTNRRFVQTSSLGVTPHLYRALYSSPRN